MISSFLPPRSILLWTMIIMIGYLAVSSVNARVFGSRGRTAAAIFGKNTQEGQQHQQRIDHRRFPPIPYRGNASSSHGQLPPPPPPPPGYYGGPPLPWQQQQQQIPEQLPWGPFPPPLPFSAGNFQRDLEASLSREQELLVRVQNMTASISTMEQREELHVRQLDVLTERVMEVENRAAQEHNELLEYRKNCTDMDRQIATLQGQVEEWRARCGEFVEKREKDQEQIRDLNSQLKKTRIQAEDLAAMIERHRLNTEEDGYRRRKQNRKGFLAWIFGWGSRDDDEYDDMLDTARSTLLKALQNERNNVEELEAALAALQQNNTAIAEQVESRDLIIEELNDRIAVFEEDKIVLKAALRQLQKEMSEEAPKTQKLVDDLEDATDEIERLQIEIESLIDTHQNEISALKQAIALKEEMIEERESNLTMIGTYVDKLEERLADFAVARRDVEVRERQLGELENNLSDVERQRDDFQRKVMNFEQEHADLKTLLEELAQARANLTIENSRILRERDELSLQVDELEETVRSLQTDDQNLRNATDHWRARAIEIENQYTETQGRNERLIRELEQSNTEIQGLNNELAKTRHAKQELEESLRRSEMSKAEIESRYLSLEEDRAVLEATRIELERRIALLKAELAKPPPPPPPLAKSHPKNVKQESDQTKESGTFDAKNQVSTINATVIHEDARTNSSQNITSRMVPRDNVTPSASRNSPERNVPLRKFRKFLSKTTGIHGLLTPSSNTTRPRVVRAQGSSLPPLFQRIPKVSPRESAVSASVNQTRPSLRNLFLSNTTKQK